MVKTMYLHTKLDVIVTSSSWIRTKARDFVASLTRAEKGRKEIKLLVDSVYGDNL